MCGRVWINDAPHYLNTLVSVGEQLSFARLDGSPEEKFPEPGALFDRSLTLTGTGATYHLSHLRFGLVGASGTGSLMAELLMRAGAGEVLLFEFDRAEESNLNRVLHLRTEDAEKKIGKAERIAAALIEQGLPTKVSVANGGDIRDVAVAKELLGCDFIVGCVDRDWPRLILSEIAYQYLLPFVDLGTEIGASETEIQSLDARVSYSGPGRPCLLCSGVVSAERVRIEGYESDERHRVLAQGYSKDLELRAPAVMDLNMRAASTAMLLIRHLLQPFLSAPLPHAIKETITNFSTKQVRYKRDDRCTVCGEPLRLGSGNSFRLTTR